VLLAGVGGDDGGDRWSGPPNETRHRWPDFPSARPRSHRQSDLHPFFLVVSWACRRTHGRPQLPAPPALRGPLPACHTATQMHVHRSIDRSIDRPKHFDNGAFEIRSVCVCVCVCLCGSNANAYVSHGNGYGLLSLPISPISLAFSSPGFPLDSILLEQEHARIFQSGPRPPVWSDGPVGFLAFSCRVQTASFSLAHSVESTLSFPL
jgi:hypothetical protein